MAAQSLPGGTFTMAAAALKLAQNLFGDLSKTRVVLIGVGEMVELAATYFAAQQPQAVAPARQAAQTRHQQPTSHRRL